jgi:cell division septum initiation protein DivIVA
MDENDQQPFEMIDLNYLIDELAQIIAEANRVPFSNKIMVEEVQVLRIVDQMRAGMPNEFIEARRVLNSQGKIIRSAQLEAEKILQRATQQAEYLLSQHGLMLEAQQRAERMLEEARLYQQRAQNDIDRYGLQRLQQVEEAIRESARLVTGSIDDALNSIQDARDRVLPSDNDD